MGLLGILLSIVVVGLLVWLILQLGLPDPYPKIVIWVSVIFLIIWILRGTGLLAAANIHI